MSDYYDRNIFPLLQVSIKFESIKFESASRDSVSNTTDNSTEIGILPQVTREVIESEHNIAKLTVPVRHMQLDYNRAACHQRHNRFR
jgi:hypothetical protein